MVQIRLVRRGKSGRGEGWVRVGRAKGDGAALAGRRRLRGDECTHRGRASCGEGVCGVCGWSVAEAGEAWAQGVARRRCEGRVAAPGEGSGARRAVRSSAWTGDVERRRKGKISNVAGCRLAKI